MDRIKEPYIIRLLEQIGEHYRTNISNRFLRPVLLQLQVDKTTWDLIEVMTEKMDLYRYQGFNLDELYREIAACARFIEIARNKSTIKSKINLLPPGHDKTLREMAFSNFASNLKVFSEMLSELYKALIEMDKEDSGNKRKPLYTQMPELYDIEKLLTVE